MTSWDYTTISGSFTKHEKKIFNWYTTVSGSSLNDYGNHHVTQWEMESFSKLESSPDADKMWVPIGDSTWDCQTTPPEEEPLIRHLRERTEELRKKAEDIDLNM